MSSDIECIKAEVHADQPYGSPMKATSEGRTVRARCERADVGRGAHSRRTP
jgi:hypothetical protein